MTLLGNTNNAFKESLTLWGFFDYRGTSVGVRIPSPDLVEVSELQVIEQRERLP